jgi:hypothetical protein
LSSSCFFSITHNNMCFLVVLLFFWCFGTLVIAGRKGQYPAHLAVANAARKAAAQACTAAAAADAADAADAAEATNEADDTAEALEVPDAPVAVAVAAPATSDLPVPAVPDGLVGVSHRHVASVGPASGSRSRRPSASGGPGPSLKWSLVEKDPNYTPRNDHGVVPDDAIVVDDEEDDGDVIGALVL